MLRNPWVHMIAVLAVGALLGYVAASSKVWPSRPMPCKAGARRARRARPATASAAPELRVSSREDSGLTILGPQTSRIMSGRRRRHVNSTAPDVCLSRFYYRE